MRGSWAAWLLTAAIVALVTWPLLRPPPRDAETTGPWRMAMRRFRRKRGAVLALAAIVALVIIAVFAPMLAPYHPNAQPDPVGMQKLPPSAEHPMGTDLVSRDVFSRVLHGAQISLAIGMLAVLLSVTVGTLYGAVAGFLGGSVDTAMMRVIDAFLSIPRILLLVMVTAFWGQLSVPWLIVLIGLTGWFGVSRVVRAEVMSVSAREFIVSARSLGASRLRVLGRHVLPNVLAPVIVAATLGIGNVIILEAGLSFLGLGVQPPRASWGSIIQDGAQQVAANWWISVFPGLAIVITVMAFNAVGEGLRDALDPR
jgi:peptide/nickel transport system permease protein